MSPLGLTTALEIRLKSVLIATDFSEASEKALHYALAIARHYGAKFYLAHVVSGLGFTLAGPEAVGTTSELVLRDARKLEENLLRSGALSGLDHVVVIREGDVWDELQNIVREEHVDLIVIGTHGRRGLGKLLLGSVAEEIFRQSHCPVLTVGPDSCPTSSLESNTPVRPFLFATDFGECSLRALPYAISLANHLKTRLVLFHVLPSVPLPETTHRYAAADVVQTREDSRSLCLDRMRQLIAQNAAMLVAPEFVIEFGSPSEQILKAADRFKAESIIMGLNHSAHVSTAAHLPWNMAHQIVCAATCPVLTVRS